MSIDDENHSPLNADEQKKLTDYVNYHRTKRGWTLKQLVELSDYKGSPKTLDHHLHGRTPWTAHATKSILDFLSLDDAVNAEVLQWQIKVKDFDFFQFFRRDGCQVWQPRERDANALLDRIERIEASAGRSESFAMTPPLWLMPKQMMKREMDRLLSGRNTATQTKLRKGLTRFERGRYALFFGGNRATPLRRYVGMLDWQLNDLVQRKPPYDHFTADDIRDFLSLLTDLIVHYPHLSFQIANMKHWASYRLHVVFGELTFIDESLWFGWHYNGAGWYWMEKEKAHDPNWPGISLDMRYMVFNLFKNCVEHPSSEHSLKVLRAHMKQIHSVV